MLLWYLILDKATSAITQYLFSLKKKTQTHTQKKKKELEKCVCKTLCLQLYTCPYKIPNLKSGKTLLNLICAELFKT